MSPNWGGGGSDPGSLLRCTMAFPLPPTGRERRAKGASRETQTCGQGLPVPHSRRIPPHSYHSTPLLPLLSLSREGRRRVSVLSVHRPGASDITTVQPSRGGGVVGVVGVSGRSLLLATWSGGGVGWPGPGVGSTLEPLIGEPLDSTLTSRPLVRAPPPKFHVKPPQGSSGKTRAGITPPHGPLLHAAPHQSLV